MILYLCAIDGQKSVAFSRFSRMSLTPERLGNAAIEPPLAPASSSPLNGGCGLRGKGLGMDCKALGNLRKSMDAMNQC